MFCLDFGIYFIRLIIFFSELKGKIYDFMIILSICFVFFDVLFICLYMINDFFLIYLIFRFFWIKFEKENNFRKNLFKLLFFCFFSLLFEDICIYMVFIINVLFYIIKGNIYWSFVGGL